MEYNLQPRQRPVSGSHVVDFPRIFKFIYYFQWSIASIHSILLFIIEKFFTIAVTRNAGAKIKS